MINSIKYGALSSEMLSAIVVPVLTTRRQVTSLSTVAGQNSRGQSGRSQGREIQINKGSGLHIADIISSSCWKKLVAILQLLLQGHEIPRNLNKGVVGSICDTSNYCECYTLHGYLVCIDFYLFFAYICNTKDR